ncbi:MAG TPA: hypothetical protein VGO18_14440 [Steroidobacteraceae bacterium]|jgi:hypothetical protein|nr:hypothetical protein [Steroidobacteraceae bacterium]
MRPVSIAVYPLACLVAAWIAGCATERLDAAAPSGVNLTGEWKFNPNLSDDPDKLADPDKAAPQRSPGSHRGHGGGRGGGGGGMPPMGGPGGTGFLPVSLTAPGVEEAAPPPPVSTPPTGGTPRSRGVSINRLLKPPVHLSISQNEGTLTIKTDMPDGTHTADQYTAGTSNTIPYGPDATADRSVGWRGPVFVVTITAKKAGWREDDFALDEDGHLIMTTQTKGGRLGSLEIKRVYDRVRGSPL